TCRAIRLRSTGPREVSCACYAENDASRRQPVRSPALHAAGTVAVRGLAGRPTRRRRRAARTTAARAARRRRLLQERRQPRPHAGLRRNPGCTVAAEAASHREERVAGRAKGGANCTAVHLRADVPPIVHLLGSCPAQRATGPRRRTPSTRR